MSISTNCPNCKSLFRLPDELAGRTAKCQKCAQLFVVPTGQAGALAPAEIVRKEEDAPVTEPPAEQPAIMPPAPPPAPPPLPPVVKLVEAVEKHETLPPPPPTRPRSEPRIERPAKSGSGSLALVLAIVGLGVFLCVICGGAGVGFYILNPRAKAPPPPKIVIIKKDGPKFDGFKDKVVFDGPKDLFKKDDRFKDAFPKDLAMKDKVDPGNQRMKIAPPPGMPTPVVFDADGLFRSESALGLADPIRDFAKRSKAYTVRMEAGKTYEIDMTSGQFDSFLYLVDDANFVERFDDDGGGYPSARIDYSPNRTAEYRIEATHFGGAGANGNFTLTVRRK